MIPQEHTESHRMALSVEFSFLRISIFKSFLMFMIAKIWLKWTDLIDWKCGKYLEATRVAKMASGQRCQ